MLYLKKTQTPSIPTSFLCEKKFPIGHKEEN